ncbi:MAG: bifunctional 4-hydroxy-2-oxoglutarate aldolase/2-dehydro-3-deoxy-phosphogluconate aldolase [Acidobacteria bacterium]|nr:bifunctional 4-hydroxy-2-oxoglutarate aldolase/2-dehydro-3-deoxy-phosphogluconate aldolase [Acidobacteriota bacterium]MBV9434486.1 bifunctional 4-hydroxy-2-oxoglutarate aldolase/2-dehydro-3-deoxy-phosphogluconate aldolase [Acidobacteriota bacterium]
MTTREQVQRKVVEIGIVPVIRASSAKKAIAAAVAVAAGGIPIVELTMTVPGCIDAIAQLVRDMGSEVLIGAGTVLDEQTARKCFEAGADFVVTPGLDMETIAAARAADKLIMAGALTPTEVITAWKAGADFVKVFPASAVGGASYIRALRGPLPQVRLVPTGGVNLQTAAEFLQAGAAALGVGSELISSAALEKADMSSITSLARQYVTVVQQVRETMKPALV